MLMQLMIIFILLILKLLMNKAHVFLTLLWLEVLALFFISSLVILSELSTLNLGVFIVYLLAIIVSEASVALACLVLLSRNSSSMNMNAMNPLKC